MGSFYKIFATHQTATPSSRAGTALGFSHSCDTVGPARVERALALSWGSQSWLQAGFQPASLFETNFSGFAAEP
jgi:hypothetical protein